MGGLERHVQCLAQSLPKDVEALICVSGRDGLASEAMREAGLEVVVLGGTSGHDPRVFWRFHKVMRAFRPDVVHAHSLALFASLYLKWFSKVPLIMSLHTPAGNRTTKDWLYQLFAKRPEYYLPVSAETWKGYQRIFPKAKGEVLFNPLLRSAIPEKDEGYVRRELGLPGDAPLVGAIGRFSPQKNWLGFLEVARLLLTRNEQMHMVAVGDGPQWKEMRATWEAMTQGREEMAQRLHWLGNRQDAKLLMGGMDVFLFLSHHEELPTVLLEAFAMKTPVVGNLPYGGTKEVLALSDYESAWLVATFDAEQVAQHTETVLRDKARAQAMVTTGRQILETHFDAEKICYNQLINVYHKVIR